MTDFLDRLVARVLPGQGGQAVVRTRPRSRFEQGAPTGVSEPGGEVQEGAPGEAARSGSPVGSSRESGQSTVSTVSPRGARTSASAPAPGGTGPGAGEGSGSRTEGVLPGTDRLRARTPAVQAPSGEGTRGPAEEGRGVADPAAVLRPVPRRSAVGGEGRDGAALAPEERRGDSAEDPGGRSRSQPRGMEVPLSPTDPGSPAPVLRPLPATPSMPGSLTPAVPGAEDVRGAREGASRPEQPPVVHLRPAPRPRGPETAPEPAPVQLRIGRVEIRGNEPAPTHRRTPLPPPQPRSPALDLAEYLRRRNHGRRP
jgi:hypothetical protein